MNKSGADSRISMVTLNRVVADYQAGLVLIDREFDDACERTDRSIANIRGESANDASNARSTLSQEKMLRQQSETIARDISKTDDEIERLGQGIAAVDSTIHSMAQQKSNLEQEIQNRWLIERLYYFFAADNDSQQCANLQRALDDRANERSELEKTRRKFEHNQLRAVSEKKNLQARLDEIHRKLAAIKKSAEYSDAQAQRLAGQCDEAENRRQSRKSGLLKSMSEAWKKAAGEILRGAATIRRQQLAFVDLRGSDSGVTSAMPESLILGMQQVSFKDLHCHIPHRIPFPFDRALILPEDNATQRRLAHHLLLRLLQAIPPGRLEVTLIDPLKLGQSFAPFLPLLNAASLMPQQRVLTRADEIERVLGELTDDAEELIQHRFKGRISNWQEFNTANPDNSLGYKVVLFFDVPEQLSDKSLWYLERLSENGPRCGILPIVAVDGRRIADRRYEKMQAALNHSTQRIDTLLQADEDDKDGLSFSYQPEEWPKQGVLDTFLQRLAEHHADAVRFNKSLPDLWVGFAKGATTIGGFDIPIGWTPAGEIVSLTLGATTSEHHALLAGKTGSGKSNLLHVMIHSLCEKYAPQEVDLYLLDYKESTEFAVYAKPPLPHARLVATESDVDYGVTVLRHLVGELESRARLFKTKDVHDFAESRNTHRCDLPRILLVIDEFQVLFTEGRQAAETAEKLLSQLLKQGRSFGIHVLLATQTLKGINALSLSSLISQLGCRIALACGHEDSAVILSGANWAAAELKSPPEGIINNANGAKSGNVKFLIPLAESAYCRAHLRQLSERASKRGIACKSRVFNGANLPRRPAANEFKTICGESEALVLGERLTFLADVLSVPLTQRQAFNVLFCGYDDSIHDGLLVSTLTSLSCAGGFDAIIYFNGRGVEPGGGFNETASVLGERLKTFNDIGLVPLQEIANAIGNRRTAVIIDGWDAEKALHPVPSYKATKPGDSLTPADFLKRIAEDGPRKGTFVFAFIDNWRQCAVSCKDLLEQFKMRVAFCMNEDDAGALVSGGIGKFKGIEKPNRAVFVNCKSNEFHWFRPFTAATGAES